MMRRSRSAVLYVLLVTLAASGCRSAPADAGEQANRVENLLSVQVETVSGPHVFEVEVARTSAEQAQGLMYRRAIPLDGGMLFPFPVPQRAVFWMKNTLIPLDLIFIRADGRVARIAANTVPYSLDPVDAGEDVTAVLEIRGGRAAALGIRAGARTQWAGQAN